MRVHKKKFKKFKNSFASSLLMNFMVETIPLLTGFWFELVCWLE
jgi:hypothetical protein